MWHVTSDSIMRNANDDAAAVITVPVPVPAFATNVCVCYSS